MLPGVTCQPCHLNTHSKWVSCMWFTEVNKKNKTFKMPPKHHSPLNWVPRFQFLTEMCLTIIPSISYEPKARPQPDTSTPYSSGDRFRDLTGSGPQSGQARAERAAEERRDKWVLSGGCGVGKLTLFPSDYINRQENRTGGGGWLEFHRTRGRRSFSLVCRLIKRPGGGTEEVCRTQSEPIWLLIASTVVFYLMTHSIQWN